MTLQNYLLQGNLLADPNLTPRIGNLKNDELGQHVLEEITREFEGAHWLSFILESEPGQPIRASNIPFALKTNQTLRELKIGAKVLDYETVLKEWKDLPERNTTYSDTTEIVIYPNEGRNEDLRKRVLDLTNKKPRTNPLIVSGLGVEKADNDYGFTFIETDYTTTESAPWLKQDGYIKHNGKKVVSCSPDDEGAVRIVVPSDQSGLRGLYRSGSDRLDAWYDDLVGSDEDGRVQIFQDPKGRVQK